MYLCASFFTNLQSQNAELIHIYYLHIARTPFGVNVHTSVSVQNYFYMYARYSHVVVSQLLRWRQTSDIHTPNTRGIRSKCYISLIWDFKKQAPVSLGMVWHDLSSLNSVIFSVCSINMIIEFPHCTCTLIRSTKLPARSLYLKKMIEWINLCMEVNNKFSTHLLQVFLPLELQGQYSSPQGTGIL